MTENDGVMQKSGERLCMTDLPSLLVVKQIPEMLADPNIDWLINIYYARHDFERCKKIIQQNLHHHFNPEYSLFVKGLIEREEGDNIGALRSFQNAVDLNSKNTETYKEVGKTLFIVGRFTHSLKVFRDIEKLSDQPEHEVFYYIGELLYRSAVGIKQLDGAQQGEAAAKLYFQKAIKYGKNLKSFQRLAEIHRKAKKYRKAIEVLEACLQFSPENTDVLTEVSVLYIKINETQKAFDRLAEVIKIYGKNSRVLLALGAIIQSRNDVDGALGKYKQITVKEPESAELWNNIGLCFFKKKKNILAISSLRKALWYSPLNRNALYNISLVLISGVEGALNFKRQKLGEYRRML